MGTYIPNTEKEQTEMLKKSGYKDFDDLFKVIPDGLKLNRELNLPLGKSELEVSNIMEDLAGQNKVFHSIFRGAGAYDHYIPAIVKSVTSKEEFVTAYTPYQAEISQGILQSIFEYQTAICELTGMDVSNASVYDAGTAAAEAITMCKDRKRSTVLISEAANPYVRSVMETYCFGTDTPFKIIPEKDGKTDINTLKALLADDETIAGVYVQQPNFFGLFENLEDIADIAHEAGAKLISGVNPMALGIMKTPAECGADIAVGDAQPLGLALGFGGPFIGFMACTSKLMRNLPGRIVGQTTDDKGNRAFVLTLQAREQHIRREKAGSNICSNEAHCALTAGVYLAALGADGLAEVAKQCMSKAHYLKNKLSEAGFKPVYEGEFFHEFVTDCPEDAGSVLKKLKDHGILGGLPIEGNRILWCATEKNRKEDIDALCDLLVH